MRKKIIILILIVIFIFLLKISIDLKSNTSSVEYAAGKIMTYKIHNDYNQGSFDYSKRGYYINTYKMPNSPWFYIISMGVQYTGGYSIDISEVKIDKNNDVEVIVKENSPKRDETVITVLTYPTVCLELNIKPNNIKIINTEGEIFKALNWN